MSQIFSQSGYTSCMCAIFSDTPACDTSCCALFVCKKYCTPPLGLIHSNLRYLWTEISYLKGICIVAFFWSHMAAYNADLSVSCCDLFLKIVHVLENKVLSDHKTKYSVTTVVLKLYYQQSMYERSTVYGYGCFTFAFLH